MEWEHKKYFFLLIIIVIILIMGIRFFRLREKNFNLGFGKNFNKLKFNIFYSARYVKFSFFLISLLFLVLALASPKYGEKSKIVEKTGIDIIFAIDISKSMYAQDIAPSRIERTKMELMSFLKLLKGDRVGLIEFAGIAYPQSPLTTDYSIIKTFLKNMNIGDIPVGGTNLELALNTAVSMFNQGSRTNKRSKLLLLVTDGESHDGNIKKAIELARKNGVIVYSIGIGSLAGELIPRVENGKSTGYLERYGKPILSKLNEKILKKISAATGGKYYGFTDNSIDLEKILGEIASLEKKSIKEEFRILKRERFQIPLFLAFLFLLISTTISEKKGSSKRKRSSK